MTKKKKIFFGILLALLLAVVVVVAGAYSMFRIQLKAANSIQCLQSGDYPIYTMDYVGDYGLDEFLAGGGASTDGELADYLTQYLSHGFVKTSLSKQPFACSTLYSYQDDGLAPGQDSYAYFGRNFDWEDCRIMLVSTKPDNGYASFSTCAVDFLGFGEDWQPDGSIVDRILALAAVYVPQDGMNEKGLCVADLMAGDNAPTGQDTDKPDLTTSTAIRLLLDRAATVDEAVELLKQYDMHHSIGAAHHLSIADATGRSVVVEYIDGELCVTDTTVVTNFYLTPGDKYGIGSEQSHRRYDILIAAGSVDSSQAMADALSSVAKSNFAYEGEGTQWSIAYDLSRLEATYYFRERFDEPYLVKLP